jgi:putative ABC transport system permease protein
VGASLFIRSFVNLKGAETGFDTAPLLTMRFYMTGEPYAADQPKVSRVDDIVRRIESLPGIEAAFASNYIPLDAGGGGGPIVIAGRTAAPGEEPVASFIAVTPHFHQTLGLPLIKGRNFTDAEGMTRSAVAVIDDVMAKRLWPDEDPIGRRFRLADTAAAARQEQPEWFTIIGVAPTIRRPDVDDRRPPVPAAFVPYPYAPTPNTGLTIRAASPASATAAVREAIRASDPGLAVFNVRLMDEVRLLVYWQYQLFGIMFGVFGAVALFLAAIGVYGVLSFSVSQRTQEIGLRMALGAERERVLRMVVRQGLTLAAAGVLFGLLGAFGVTRVIRTLLYRVTPTDPVSFLGVAAFLTLIAVLASYLPARRATTVDPVVALRSE